VNQQHEFVKHEFVNYLESLAAAGDRAALAALRRGLGQPPGTAPDMFPYVVRRLPESAWPGSWEERCYYLIAALFAYHPVSASEGNLGSHFARTLDRRNPDRNAATERRFEALLTAHPDDLHFYLRQAISFLRSKDETPINWHQLMSDVRDWGRAERRTGVQKRWATQFWRRPAESDERPATDH
jgi:CRISPR system Cascade subunit CasB